MKRYLFTTIFILFGIFSATAQEDKLHLLAGYGYYEASFIGVKYKPKSYGLQIGLGHNLNLDNIAYASIHTSFLADIEKLNSGNFTFGWAVKTTYWRQADNYLIWKNLGASLSITSNFQINSNVSVFSSLGVIKNFQLANERLSLEQTGWVKPLDIDFQIGITYAL